MTRTFFCSLIGFATLFCVSPISADVIFLTPTGHGGPGLLASNVTVPAIPINPGSGGVGPTGISIDTVNSILHVDIQWGSENGYTDMSGEVTMLHLHGLTDDPAPTSFDQVTTNILVNMGNSLEFNSSATGGGIVDDFFINPGDVPALLNGRIYINVHTALNSTGEIRGYLLAPVPEPGSGCLWVVVGLLCGRRSRRITLTA